ncbi:hypothetical protein MMC19_006125 [Ptychographa xylographoides]|nr:hypothetical protein [Ptychographa xylographoides]
MEDFEPPIVYQPSTATGRFETAEFEEWLNLDGALEALSPAHSTTDPLFSTGSNGSTSPSSFERRSLDSVDRSNALPLPPPAYKKRKALGVSEKGDARGIRPQGKKTSHNVVEKRYRSNLNDKIATLRDSVPALRLASRRTSANDASSDSEGTDGAAGPSSQVKLNKATVLTKATEYIKQLELHNKRLVEENSALLSRLKGIVDTPQSYATVLPYETTSSPHLVQPPLVNVLSPPKPEPRPEGIENQASSSSLSTEPVTGMIKVPDDIRRLRTQAQQSPEEHYAPDNDFSTGTRGRFMSRLLLGSLATLMVMEGLSETEQDWKVKDSTPGGRGLFALPTELLRESRGFREPIRRRIIEFGYAIRPHAAVSLSKLILASFLLFAVFACAFELGRKRSKMPVAKRRTVVDPATAATSSVAVNVVPPLTVAATEDGTALCEPTSPEHSENVPVSMSIRGFFARQAIGLLGCSWLQADMKDEEAASLPGLRAEDFIRRWRTYSELLPKLLDESHGS